MANLTLVIDDEVLLQARKRALEQGTSVNALVRSYLEGYAQRPDAVAAMSDFVERAAAAGGRSSGPWTREQLHDR